MSDHNADIIIVGAGIAGLAAAYYLSKSSNRSIVVVDKLQPMSLTTACSGENFRNFWPQDCMTQLTTRSYELMQELIKTNGNVFSLKQTGYEFISKQGDPMFGEADPSIVETTPADRDYLASDVSHITRVHQAGAFDVYGLGSLLLKLAREQGVHLLQQEVVGIDSEEAGYMVMTDSESLRCRQLVVAAGPFVNDILSMLDVLLPVESICQSKFVIPDPHNVIPRDMPFTICADSIVLPWEDAEREAFREDPELRWLTEKLPAGLHVKPEGADRIKLGWAYNRQTEAPSWNCRSSELFPDVVMRGASQYVPGLEKYVETMPTPITTFAGYYTRTKDNLPLICPVQDGAFVIAGLSGYGTMSACAAGELCTAYLSDSELPEYAKFFNNDRYADPELASWLASIDNDGQL